MLVAKGYMDLSYVNRCWQSPHSTAATETSVIPGGRGNAGREAPISDGMPPGQWLTCHDVKPQRDAGRRALARLCASSKLQPSGLGRPRDLWKLRTS